MQYGCCTKVLENRGEPAVYRGSLIKACGYTYAELPMYRLMELSDSQIRTLRDEMKELGLSFESSNCFYPASMRLTGAGIDMGAILDYAARAFELAASLGIRAIVLGSPVSRTVPAGFSKAAAREQLAEALTGMSKLCAPLGVDVAFEACNIYINNLIVNLDEALELCRDVTAPASGWWRIIITLLSQTKIQRSSKRASNTSIMSISEIRRARRSPSRRSSTRTCPLYNR